MYDKLVLLFLTACFLGTAQCQSASETVDDALNKAKQIIPELNNLNLTSLNISALPIDKAENALREKCTKNGGSYEDAKNAGAALFTCTKDIVNFNTLQQEIKDHRVDGTLDEVFKKYCVKKPTVKKCITDFANGVENCLEPVEKETKKTLEHIADKVIDFVCHKEGDRIALFVAAKGPECFKQKAEGLKNCGNSTFGSYAKNVAFNPADGITGAAQSAASLFDPKNLPLLTFDAKSCRNVQDFQSCAVETLEECEDPTPANLLDSIFNFIKKVTPCKDLLKNAPSASALTMAENSASKNVAFAAVFLAASIVVFT